MYSILKIFDQFHKALIIKNGRKFSTSLLSKVPPNNTPNKRPQKRHRDHYLADHHARYGGADRPCGDDGCFTQLFHFLEGAGDLVVVGAVHGVGETARDDEVVEDGDLLQEDCDGAPDHGCFGQISKKLLSTLVVIDVHEAFAQTAAQICRLRYSHCHEIALDHCAGVSFYLPLYAGFEDFEQA